MIKELDVNEDDYERGQNDIRFAQTSLRHAQILEKVATTSSTHKTSAEDESLHVETESMESQEQDAKEECEANINTAQIWAGFATEISFVHYNNRKIKWRKYREMEGNGLKKWKGLEITRKRFEEMERIGNNEEYSKPDVR
ncbi:hypothetical protein QE152_g39727 [Popillia japonica]|uniref:Uncharacterized protein n=1 Tax=Popillia japonica TaxID=7064 RepID=A0AAW1HTZ3_POPJA